MRKITIILLLVSCIILSITAHNLHQKTDEVISESNYKMQTIQFLIVAKRYGQALKLLKEWGIEYCTCVA